MIMCLKDQGIITNEDINDSSDSDGDKDGNKDGDGGYETLAKL